VRIDNLGNGFSVPGDEDVFLGKQIKVFSKIGLEFSSSNNHGAGSFQKGDHAMVVTATEFKTNFGKYLDLLLKEDIFITRNGKTIAKVVNPHVSAVDSISGLLSGKVPEYLDRKSIREERISKYAIDD
jgi:antitoxin (DNA-binding transcriptional repressor) of toxin-antitoxin stability system